MFANIIEWMDQRIPMKRVWNMHIAQYPAPRNFNFWYIFGFLAMFVLINQIVTGIWLTMNYVPSGSEDFSFQL